jgi:two-component system NtrC family response regulator
MEDIKELTTYHMNKLCERYRVGTKGFSPDFLDALASYEWPGNVRELVNTLEAALVSAQHEPTMFAKYLPASMRIRMATKSLNKKTGARAIPEEMDASSKALPKFRTHLDKCKKQYVKGLMALSQNDIGKACQISGMSRSSLYDHLKKYNVPIPR